MSYLVISLVLLPLIAAVYSVMRLAQIKRTKIGFNKKSCDEQTVNSRFLVIALSIFSNVIYGLLEMFMLYNQYDSLNAPEIFRHMCIIAVLCGCATCIIQGIIGKAELEKGALYDGSAFSKCILKICIPELIAIAGLIYFMLGFVMLG